jgi:hypothetical protein
LCYQDRPFFRTVIVRQKTYQSYLQGHSGISRASSRHADDKGGYGRAAPIPDTVLPVSQLIRLSWAVASRRLGATGSGGRLSVIMPPRRWKGTSRRPPIGWPQRGPGGRRPHVPSGLLEPRPLCRSPSRPAFDLETPNGEARDCVRGRRTPPAGGWSRRYRAGGGRATDVFMKRLVKLPIHLERAIRFSNTHPMSARSPFNQPRECARERVAAEPSSSAFFLAGISEVTHPFIRALQWHVMCRRTGGSERRSSALLRTALTCGQTSVRACSSSLTTSQTYTGALTPVSAVASATGCAPRVRMRRG